MRVKKTRCVCGKKVRIPKSRVGQIGKCPRCQRTISVSQEIFASPQEDVTITSATQRIPSLRDKEFAHYRVIEKLGRGGMGVVYKVQDTLLKRIVALKIMLHATSQQIQRFQKEKQALAQLKHPNIVQIFEVGTEPQSYYTMEYVVGETLDNIEEPLKAHAVALLFQKIAEALATAHDEGIIHRDIKPSNIMIDDKKEPKLMDFGLAKFAKDSQVLSKTGDMLGTIAYMSPEQANGEKVDYTSDIYSFGATLYQILTGRPPFQGETSVNIIYQICYKDVVEPRFLNPDIPIDLEAICLKCLEKSKSRRYANARKLAQDLENFRLHKTIVARPPSSLTRIRKFIFRNKIAVATFSMFLCILIATTGSYVYFLKQSSERARKAEQLAKLEKSKKEKDAEIANLRLGKIALNMAIEAAKNEKWQHCAAFSATSFAFVRSIPKEQILQNKAQSLLQAAIANSKLIWRTGSYANFDSFIKSTDEQWIVTNWFANRLQLWSNQGILKKYFIADNEITSFAIHPNNQNILIGTIDGAIEIHDMWIEKKWRIHVGKQPIVAVHFLTGANMFFSVSENQVCIWNSSTRQQLASLTFPNAISASAPAPQKNEFAIATHNKLCEVLLLRYQDHKIQLYKKLSLPFSETYSRNDEKILSLQFSTQGEYLAAMSEYRYLIWKSKKWQLYFTHIIDNDESEGLYRIATKKIHNFIDFSRNGKLFGFVTARDIYFGQLENPTSLSKIKHNGDYITTFCFLDNSKLIIGDERIRIWNIQNNKIEEQSDYHTHKIRYLKTNGQWVASACWRHKIILWQKNGQKKWGIVLNGLQNMTFFKENLVWLNKSNVLFFLDLQLLRVTKTIDLSSIVKQNEILATAFSHNGRYLACCFLKDIVIWDIEKQRIAYQLKHGISNINISTMHFSPNGKVLILNQFSQSRMYRLQKNRVLSLEQDKTVGSNVLLTDTHFYYTSTNDKDVVVQNLYMSKKSSIAADQVKCMAVNDHLLAVANNKITIYNKNSLNKITTLSDTSATKMLFLEKDQILITGHKNGELKSWDLSFLQPKKQIATTDTRPHKRIVFDPYGKKWIYMGKRIIAYRVSDDQVLWQDELDESFFSGAFSSDGKVFIVTSVDNQVIHYDASTGRVKGKYRLPVAENGLVAENGDFALSDFWLPTPYESRVISTEGKVWNIKTQKYMKSTGKYLAFSASGKYFLTQSGSRLGVWEGRRLEKLYELENANRACVSFSEKYVAFENQLGQIVVFDMNTRKAYRIIDPPLHKCRRIFISYDDKYLIVQHEQDQISFWNIETGAYLQEIRLKNQFIEISSCDHLFAYYNGEKIEFWRWKDPKNFIPEQMQEQLLQTPEEVVQDKFLKQVSETFSIHNKTLKKLWR